MLGYIFYKNKNIIINYYLFNINNVTEHLVSAKTEIGSVTRCNRAGTYGPKKCNQSVTRCNRSVTLSKSSATGP